MAFPSSSSAPTKKKTTKYYQIQKPSSSKATSLIKRQETVFKKAYELSTLCGTEVCVICYRSEGGLKTWPEDREKVKDMARRYSELSVAKRRKGQVDLGHFLQKIKQDDLNQEKKNSSKMKKVELGFNYKYPDWDPRYDSYSAEQLMELIQTLEHRLRAVFHSQKQSYIHNINTADQEQMITGMNHLQQPLNQVSLYPFNYEDGPLSQFPLYASDFNQTQSRAPLPMSLIMYPNSNVES